MRDVAEIVGGGTPRSDDPSNFAEDGIPWITPADLSGYSLKTIERGARFLSRKGLETSGARLMPAGTVLFSSRAPIGYVAVASKPVSTNQGFKSFVLADGLLADYVYYFLHLGRDFALSLASGTTFAEISAARARLIPVPVAPTKEQRRIVDAIETYLPGVDDGLSTLRRAKGQLARYRASVLKAACEGRIVPTEAALARAEGRGYESADHLLARILEQNRTSLETDRVARVRGSSGLPSDLAQSKKHREAAQIDHAALPTLPPGWTWTTVGQVSTQIQYGTSARANETGRGVPVLRMGNIVDGRLQVDDLKYLPPTHGEFPALLLAQGDLLFNRTNSAELVGKTAVYRGIPTPCSFASYLIRVRLFSGVLPELVTFAINGARGRAWIRQVVSQQVGQANVNGSKLSQFPLALPPLAEQYRIVAEVQRRLSIAETVAASIDASLTRASRLREAILRRAFEGKLVPQDPNDEPASLLLERIRKERGAAAQASQRAPRQRRTRSRPTRARTV